MSTTSTEVQSDLAAICQSLLLNQQIDPAIAKRVQERAERITKELGKNGPVKMVDDLLRESREE